MDCGYISCFYNEKIKIERIVYNEVSVSSEIRFQDFEFDGLKLEELMIKI